MTRAATRITVERVIGLVALVLAAIGPLIFSTYFVAVILTQVFFLGIAAASLIFLSAYGGMVSLAQVAIYGVAGFTVGNVVTKSGETHGLTLGWNPWLGVLLGLLVGTGIALIFGAIASRSTGIYFLMITLTFSVIANYFFGQVTTFSGFGGVSNIDSHNPSLVGNPDAHPNRLYYAALVAALAVYVLIRYVVRTPAGLALQGVRDDPVRMSALGYNVPVHRTLSFAFAGFIASLAGVLFVWWQGHIDPATIDLSAVIDLLIVAVIGGLYRVEGAWVGALVFVVLNNYLRNIGVLHHIGIDESRFHTVIGAIFLIIVLLSPGGLLGIWRSALDAVSRASPHVAPAGAGRREEAASAAEQTGR